MPSDERPSIVYSTQYAENQGLLHILPSGLLAENFIRKEKPCVKWKENIPLLTFWEPEKEFDPFSAVFYMASRYEEYLPFTGDNHGRFPASASLAFQNNFLHLPVVHLWAFWLGNEIQKIYPLFSLPKTKASALFTYDIDVAYAYLGRSLTTQVLSFGKDLLTGRISNAVQKIKTDFGKKNDPSDTYNLLKNNPLPTLFFFLLSKKRTRYDRNISPEGTVLKTLIRKIASWKTGIGIHPSYLSSNRKELIASEKKTLESIVNQQITASRQHYLRFQLPGTFRELAAVGLLNDYSMQFPEMPGFRAGICVPFPFFDLVENRETGLMLHPGCIMETTFRDDLHLSASESMDWYLKMWQQVRAVGGTFISIWHNDTLWDGLPDSHPLAFRQVHNRLIEIISGDLGQKS